MNIKRKERIRPTHKLPLKKQNHKKLEEYLNEEDLTRNEKPFNCNNKKHKACSEIYVKKNKRKKN